ncbi:Minor histocompatibility antigen H13 [Choanephora cucurbitarum]|uniref:Minor histocompatibility antigen H13 n=1 Tax=Choanephora cucurbitarum TaxID=101091 RepID=A0A1C7NDN0_9FUNG|nr:Minor histocompatibility antigen H13 [Choanephora cucurbitarum]
MSTEKILRLAEDRTALQIASLGLLSLAIFPIITGSFSSLITSTQPDPPQQQPQRRTRYPRKAKSTRNRREYIQYSSEDEVHDVLEHSHQHDSRKGPNVLTIRSTFLLPLASSSVAYMISSLIHTVDPYYINHIITIIASILSCTALSSTTITIAKQYLPQSSQFFDISPTKTKKSRHDAHHTLGLCHLHVTLIHLLIFGISGLLAIAYALTHNWILGNVFAISLSIQAIRTFTLDSFGTGFFLLIGMLAYDLFWVFGTDAMVEISKSLKDAPTSVVWPKIVRSELLEKLIKKDHFFTMFGLGEIIVPEREKNMIRGLCSLLGIFIAYCLRFDRHNAHKKGLTEFPKPYFLAALAAYALGAGGSIYSVHFTSQPQQSAFVFVTPALILSTILVAMHRRELNYITDCSVILKTLQEIKEQEIERPVRQFRANVRKRSISRGNRRTSFAGEAFDAMADVVNPYVENTKKVIDPYLNETRKVVDPYLETTKSVIDPYLDETRKAVEPYMEEAMDGTYQLMDETKKTMEPYVDEAIKSTKRAIHSAATTVQEQTVVDDDDSTDYTPHGRPRRQRRPTEKSLSPTATRRKRSTSKRGRRKKVMEAE